MDDDRKLAALPAVAREAIRARLEKRAARPGVPPGGPLARPAPVFVTLRIDGELRGCMGELEAGCGDLVAETMDRALVAAFRDPRFPPLTLGELERCRVDVTILGALEEVDSEDDLDPQRYGIEVEDEDGRRAVLLPAIDGVETAEEQVALTRRKAEIPDGAPVTIRRFRATRIEEGAA